MWSPLELWSPVEVRRVVAAPPDEVFDTLGDPDTYPDWLVGAQRMRAVDPAFPSPGAEFHHSVGPTEGATVDDSSEAVAVEQDRRLVLDVRAGPFRGTVEFLLQPVAGGGTEIVLRERPAGPLVVLTPVLRPGLAARNQESLRRLARRLEAGA